MLLFSRFAYSEDTSTKKRHSTETDFVALLGDESPETLRSGYTTYEFLRRREDRSLIFVGVSSKVKCEPGTNAPPILSTKKDVAEPRVLRDTKLVEARYRDLLESTPDGIVLVNPTGHVVFANSHAERLFGHDRRELREKVVENLLPQRFRHGHIGHRTAFFFPAPHDGRRPRAVRPPQGMAPSFRSRSA